MTGVASRVNTLLQRLDAWRQGLVAGDVKAICPSDSWVFRPRYTDGRCPLCGWEPPGAVVRLPLSRRVDRFGWMAIALLLVSVLMALLVSLVYARA